MSEGSLEELNELADLLNSNFDELHNHGFKDVSFVIDTSSTNHDTLIVHVNCPNATDVADDVEEFLHEHGARTEREYYAENDVRVLTTP